jgi:UDP-3-O-[3-hydroxymyristoyl] N-acetylglucosamine deacetylase/3-hydroxyacyl-[acyl-carrier-protein] dehydratase
MNSNKQSTVSQELSWQGIALHTGVQTKVSVQPADVDHGIKWVRSDISEMTPIKAEAKYVASTTRSTDLSSGGNDIKTIEHLMSALSSSGIDNALVVLVGEETPILDGSAKPFYDQLISNRTEQDQNAKIWGHHEMITFEDGESGSSYTVLPAEELSIEVVLEYDSDRVGQKYASLGAQTNYGEEIAGARTFVFSSELIELANAGLIKGGSLDNAIVIPSKNTLTADLEEALQLLGRENVSEVVEKVEAGYQLKSDNELAKHKLLDLIGDLALLGARFKGRIIAKRPGHTGNIAFVKHLTTLLKKDQKLRGLPIYDPRKSPVLNSEQVMEMLPHRYPFMLVDKVIELSDRHVVGVKNITFNEQLFQGHFPNNPVFPGVLQMEALAQAGGIFALSMVENPSNWDTYFLKMDNVKFKNMVKPGDTLLLKVVLLSPIRRGIVQMQGTAYVGDKIVSEGELTAQIVDRTK